jgi:hypothetical protein
MRRQVNDTFLHQDKRLSPDQAIDLNAPSCAHCGHSMWLGMVQRTLSDSDIAWHREYECKTCGTVTVTHTREPLRKAG